MHIIGIRIKDGCDPNILKNLKPGWYPFGDYIEPTKTNGYKWRKGNVMSDRLYQLHPKMPQISVSCVIGMNGSGKTTLFDILFRILNNFISFLPKTDKYDMYSVEYEYGLNASLYFEVDGIIGCIENIERKGMDEFDKKGESNLYLGLNADGIFSKVNKGDYRGVLYELFYTIGVNYSIHSMRFEEYNGTDSYNNWLCNLFHNEADYLIPITFSPYRVGGQIDVTLDDYLANRRIMTLAILFHSQEKELIKGYKPQKVSYSISEKYLKEREDSIDNLANRRHVYSSFPKIKELMHTSWERRINTRIGKNYEDIKTHIIKALSYETLWICMTYKSYIETFHLEEIALAEERNDNNPENKGQYDAIIEKLYEQSDKNSITIEISQIFSFLLNYKKQANGGNITIDDFISENLPHGKNTFRTFNEVYKILPPHFYDVDLYFAKDGDNNHLIPLSQFSSGEKQLLYNISAVLYHVFNIANTKEEYGITTYKHINIVLDEVELYSHPEFQRKYIASLIDMLAGLHIDNTKIRSINMIIATHSPFILSDVPKENVLCLKDGKRQIVDFETYCANIYDILNNSFFLDYPMGESARRVLDVIIQEYNHRRDNRKHFSQVKDNRCFYEYLKDIISEPYLKSNVSMMIDCILNYNQSERDKLVSRKKKLEEEIKEINEKLGGNYE